MQKYQNLLNLIQSQTVTAKNGFLTKLLCTGIVKWCKNIRTCLIYSIDKPLLTKPIKLIKTGQPVFCINDLTRNITKLRFKTFSAPNTAQQFKHFAHILFYNISDFLNILKLYTTLMWSWWHHLLKSWFIRIVNCNNYYLLRSKVFHSSWNIMRLDVVKIN